MTKVSIIVPIYNSERYLAKCLHSIRNQTLEDFECILVDDGSTDSSGHLCDEFCSIDGRFRVFHTENGGVGRARNIGIGSASGEFIGFVDSDDWIEPTMYESMYSKAIEHGADVSICGVECNGCNGKMHILTGKQAVISMYSDSGVHGYSCNKLFRRDLFQERRYDEALSCYEDLALFHCLLRDCDVVVWNDVPLYHYEVNGTSVTSCGYGLNDRKQKGREALGRLLEIEQDHQIKDALGRYLYTSSLENAIDYVAHRDLDNDYYPVVYDIVKSDKTMFRRCSLRQRVWRMIVLCDSLKRLYWFMRRTGGNG